MPLIVPNLDRLTKVDPKLGEAFKRIQDYTNQNVTSTTGNRLLPPGFVNPQQRPG